MLLALGLLLGALGPLLGALESLQDAPSSSTASSADVAYSPVIAPASDEGRAAILRIQVPGGFQVELWAAEPMLANPVCLWPDARGRIYVAETFRHHKGVTDLRDHMDWLDEDVAAKSVEDRVAMMRAHAGERFSELYEREHERIRLLSDTDGDGVADSATVFADGFKSAASGIGAGLLARGRDVFYACIPDLWKLSDTDGDGRADERRALSSGYGVHIAMLGHDLHGLRIGPDGRLYFSCGDRGLRVETSAGVLDNSRCGAVLRCELDGSNLEVFATGLRNPQELAFDAFGELFTGDNNSDGGDAARFVHVIEGGDSGWRYGYQWLTEPVLRGPWNGEKLWVPAEASKAAYLVPPLANFSHGPAGFCAYPGTGFGEEWSGRFFLVDFEGTPGFSGIDTFRVKRKGASFEIVDAERFAWRFCATDCDFGPDGALYACDWVDGWAAPGKGRIYRISNPSQRARPIVAAVAKLLAEGMATRSADELVGLLAHEDQRVRQEAHLELASRGEQGREALARAARSSLSLAGSLHAIWGLGVACRLDPSASRAPLLERTGDGDAEIRAQAARALGDLREKSAVPALIALLSDPNPRVRLLSAIALGRIGDARAVEPLFVLARAPFALAHTPGEADPALRHGAIFGLQGCATTERLLEAARDVSEDARVAAVVALRRRGEPRVSAFLADASSRVRLETARAIYDEPIEAALPDLAGRLAADLVAERTVEHHFGRRALAACLALGGEGRARLLAKFASDARQEEDLRAEALAHLARWKEPGRRDPFMGEWRPRPAHDASFLGALVASMENELLDVRASGGIDPVASHGPASRPPARDGTPVAVAAAYVRLSGDLGAKGLADRFTAIARESAGDADLRAATVEALGKLAPPDLEATLTGVLFDEQGKVRAAALRAYQAAFPGKVLPLLSAALEAGGVPEQRVALHGLGKIRDGAADEILLAELSKQSLGLSPPELALDLALAAEARAGEAVKSALRARAEARKTADAAIADYLDCQFGGDAEKGRKVFRENASLTCLKCHRVGSDAAIPGGPNGTHPTDGTGGAEPGGIVGPDLAGVGDRLTRLQLLEAILDPNRVLSRGYEGVVFTLADESYVEGAIVSETADLVKVRRPDGTEVELRAAEIAARRKGLSAMPEGLRQYVSREDLRDLVEYLATRP